MSLMMYAPYVSHKLVKASLLVSAHRLANVSLLVYEQQVSQCVTVGVCPTG